MKSLQPSEPSWVWRCARRWVPGYRVPSSVRVCCQESDFSSGDPFLQLTVDTPTHNPWILIAHPSSPQPRVSHSCSTQPSTQLLGRVYAALRRQTWVQSHPPFPTCSPSWMNPCVSQSLPESPPAHRGSCPHGL